MAAAVAAEGPVILEDLPDLTDIQTMRDVLRSIGMEVEATNSKRVTLKTMAADRIAADPDAVSRMRAGICVLGGLLGKRGRARVPLPGGCRIGDRPIDLHLRGLEALGAVIRVEGDVIVADARRLRGARIDMGGPSGSTVTGTCNVLTAACFATGTTEILNAACEPEVVDVAKFLNACGAKIQGAGTSQIVINGAADWESQPVTHRVIPDRIEAGTMFIAAAATRGQLTIDNVPLDHLQTVCEHLRRTGAEITIGSDFAADDPRATVTVDGRSTDRAVDVIATPYPGFPTDLQAQWTTLMCGLPGRARVSDRVFPERFQHIHELRNMGAYLMQTGGSVEIHGGRRLRGSVLNATDLRASAALVIAALAAVGQSIISGLSHLDRGYESLESRLSAVGAEIQRIPAAALRKAG